MNPAQPSKNQLKRERRKREKSLRGTPAWEIARVVGMGLLSKWVFPVSPINLDNIQDGHTLTVRINKKTYTLRLEEVEAQETP